MEDRNYGYATETPEDIRPLDNLSGIADEAERTIGLISAFISRFRHGASLAQNAVGASVIKPVPSGHVGQIERLQDAVASIDKLARELNTLG